MPRYQEWWREYRTAIFISLFGVAASLYLHLYFDWSPLRLGADGWEARMNAHLTWYPFKIRLLQTYSTIALSELAGISVRLAYYLVQYTLAFVLGLLFFRYLRRLNFNRARAAFGLLLLVTSASILGAHFEPIHTWDDFWVYIFLVLAFGAIVERRWLLVGVAFTLGCFAREQTLFFYPLLMLAAWQDRHTVRKSLLLVSLLIPVVVFGAYYASVWEHPDPVRWSYYVYSFENPARTADSIISLIDGFGFLWIVAAFGFVRLARQKRDRTQSLIFWSALYAVPITTAFATLYTLIRETRILFPPFLFVIPLAVWEIEALIPVWQQMTRRKKTMAVVAVVALVILGRYAADWFWPVVDYGGSVGFRRGYAGISLGLAASFLLARWYAGRALKMDSPPNKTAP